jgi:hypothetical protein
MGDCMARSPNMRRLSAVVSSYTLLWSKQVS